MGLVVLLVVGIALALQLSSVQTWATGKAAGWLEAKIGTPVRIARVDIDFVKTIELEGIYVEDQSRDTLLYAGRLAVDVGLLALGKQEINLNSVALERTVIKLRKPEGMDVFNFQYIVDAFADTTAPEQPADTGKGWTIDLEQARLAQIRFLLDDRFGDSRLDLNLRRLQVDLDALGLQEQHPKLKEGLIDGLTVAYQGPKADTAQVIDSTAQKVEELSKTGTAKVLNESGWGATLARLELRDIAARYTVTGATPPTKGIFDYKHLDVTSLGLTLTKVEVGKNDVAAILESLAFEDRTSGFKLDNLAFEAEIHNPAYELRLKELRMPHSRLSHGITAGVADLDNANGVLATTYVRAIFKQDSLAVRDIRMFAPVVDTMGLTPYSLKLDGGLALKGERAIMSRLRLLLNGQNYLELNGGIAGFTDINKMQLTELRHTVALNPRFAARFLPKGTLPPEAFKLGQLKLDGQASGGLSGLSGRLALESAAGRLALQRYFYKTNPSFTTHEGSARLETDNLRPAVLLGPGLGLGPISMTADVAGGYSPKTGPRLSKGEVLVRRALYQGYVYQNARLSATYLDQVAKAHLRYNDRNLGTDLKVLADLRNTRAPLFTASGPIRADLRRLRFTKDTLAFSTALNARVRGTDINTMQAQASLLGTKLQQANRKAALDTLMLTLGNDSGRRLLAIRSEVLQARMSGRFQLASLGDAMTSYIAKYVPLSGLKVIPNLPEQDVKLALHIPARPKALEVAVPGLKVPQPLNLNLRFNSRREIFDTRLDIADLRFDKNQVAGLRFTTESGANTWNIGMNAEVIAADSFVIPKPALDFTIREGNAAFRLSVAAEDADSRARLRGRILSLGELTKVQLDSSKLFLEKQEWRLSRNAFVEYATNHLEIRNFLLANAEDSSKYVLIRTPEGVQDNALQARIHNLAITDITRLIPPLGYDLAGLINLDASVDNVFDASGLKAQLAVDSIKVNGARAGDLLVKALQPAKDRVGLDVALVNFGNTLKLDGTYNLADTNRALDFRLSMDHFKPDNLAPVLKDFVAQWTGDLSADISVKGRVSSPDIGGYLAFNGKNILQPTFTQVPYQIIDQRIAITRERVNLNKFTLLDEEGQALTVDGVVNIVNLAAPSMDLSIKADNFHLLNTRGTDNATFYGDAIITTDMTVKGPAASLAIDGRVVTEEGTRITYNLTSGEPATAAVEKWITFVNTQDSTNLTPGKPAQVQIEQTTEATGLGLDLNIRLKKGTRFLVIIDPATGDKLECEGTANLRFSMKPNGEIGLQGDYNLTDGYYSMNLLGVISRKFQVRDGSTLSWAGDPANARINLTAAFTTKAARFELVADQEDAMTEAEVQAAKRRDPVSVILKITNTIQQPEIKFDLETPETSGQSSTQSSTVAARIQQIKSNENELNKQALGLIAFNRFVNTGENTGGGGQSTTEQVADKVDQTVSELLSRQLSQLSSEYLGGVEINVDVGTSSDVPQGSNSSFTDKNVGVSVARNFANDRLRVSVGSQVTTGSGSAAGQGSGSGTPVLGDVTAEYRLNKKGNVNLKVFRSYNQNSYINQANERIGASLAHNKNFSSFKRLFWNKERRREAALRDRQMSKAFKEQFDPAAKQRD